MNVYGLTITMKNRNDLSPSRFSTSISECISLGLPQNNNDSFVSMALLGSTGSVLSVPEYCYDNG